VGVVVLWFVVGVVVLWCVVGVVVFYCQDTIIRRSITKKDNTHTYDDNKEQ
jgi:hypothetical protein